MKDKRIDGASVLVTGAGGFIGSHLSERLVRGGARLRALVHYNSRNDAGHLERVPSEVRREIEIVQGDVTDALSVRRAIEDREIVFHLASLIGIPYSYLAPHSYVATNVLGTLNVMQACLDAGVEKVVHTSTSETYGTSRYVPMDEAHPLQGQSPYSASKIGADKLVESYHLAFGLPAGIIRPFNTYGPRQSARAVIPTIISQAMRGGPLALGSISPTRDLNYVDDTVDGFIRMAVSGGSVGEVINIGSGQEISIGNLARRILAIMGVEAEILTDERRVRPARSEVERLLADNSKARRLLGWEPKVPLEEGLQQTVAWVTTHPHLYSPDSYNT